MPKPRSQEHPADELAMLVEILDALRADQETLISLGLHTEAGALAGYEKLVKQLIASALDELP